jgi:hypothetical protein
MPKRQIRPKRPKGQKGQKGQKGPKGQKICIKSHLKPENTNNKSASLGENWLSKK